jgi:hypothetical protein
MFFWSQLFPASRLSEELMLPGVSLWTHFEVELSENSCDANCETDRKGRKRGVSNDGDYKRNEIKMAKI